MPSNPAMSGYAFGGWYTSTDGNGSQFTAETPVTSDITVYANWTTNRHTVTFDAGEGSLIQTRVVNRFESLGSNMPPDPNPSDNNYAFDGWYDNNGSQFTAETPVTSDITVYARWGMPDDLSLNDSLGWISNNAAEGGSYTIILKKDETIAPRSLTYGEKTVGITIKGDTTERTISSTDTGSLFKVERGVTLTLDANLTLQGWSGNTAAFIQVNSGGVLVMNAGSKIAGNAGGGVNIIDGAFTMNDGTISDNTASGVIVNGGTFTMSSGTISDNTASSYKGGGVYVSNNGAFTMSGGTISGNTVSSSSYSSTYNGGAGVYVYDGTFTMSGGTISGNTVSSASASSSYNGGGGVYVYNDGTFTMKDGTISGNSAYYGGGVYVYSGSGLFTKEYSGTIYGSDEDSELKNTANSGDSYGHAVYVYSPSGNKKRNDTAGRWVALNSSKSISEGGGWDRE
jgi:uncharacterized repeat protein (TIGR02543 family)